jgi:hypothetical protein
VASNYFNQFALEDSATRNKSALAAVMNNGGFDSPEALQPALWWYNGSVGRYIARPPVVSEQLTAEYLPDVTLVAAVQRAIPLPVDQGEPTSRETGVVEGAPTLFICGEADPYLLCSEPWAFREQDVSSGNYSYYGAACAHGLLSVGDDACDTEDDALGVMEAITAHILLASAVSTDDPTPTPTPTTYINLDSDSSEASAALLAHSIAGRVLVYSVSITVMAVTTFFAGHGL